MDMLYQQGSPIVYYSKPRDVPYPIDGRYIPIPSGKPMVERALFYPQANSIKARYFTLS